MRVTVVVLLTLLSNVIPAAADDDVKTLIGQLAFDQPKSVRMRAAAVLRLKPEQSFAAIPALKRSVKSDPDPKVRMQAVQSLGMIAYQKKPRVCPVELFEAWEDVNQDVREIATSVCGMFVHREDDSPRSKLIADYPPEALKIVLRVAKSKDAGMRANAVMELGYFGARSNAAAAAIRTALSDDNWNVRYHAYLAAFHAFDDYQFLLCGYLNVADELRRDKSAKIPTKKEFEKLPQARQRELRRRNLFRISLPMMFGERAKNDPKAVSKALGKLLGDPSPGVRQSAAIFLGENGAMPDAPDVEPNLPAGFPAGLKPKRKLRPGRRPGTWLKQHGLYGRLQDVAKNDADEKVRRAAAKAVEQTDVKASLWKSKR